MQVAEVAGEALPQLVEALLLVAQVVAGRPPRSRPTTAWPWLGCRCGERKFRAGLILRAKWLHTFLDIFVAQLTTSRRTVHTHLADEQFVEPKWGNIDVGNTMMSYGHSAQQRLSEL